MPGKKEKLSLLVTHPELAKEADGWDPSLVTSGSNKKLGWICSFGHHWDAVIGSRTKGSGCPVCANQLVLAGFNDLATTHPEISTEADGWDPQTVISGSHKKLSWKCQFGHQWYATPGNRTGSNQGCGVCVGRQVLAGFNDLATTHPEISNEAYEWDPTKVTAGSERLESWICPQGHIWDSRIYSRTGKTLAKCPICSGRKLLTGFNDLKTTHPNIASEADGWDPTKITYGSGNAVKWKCNLSHQWKTSPNSRTSQGSGCPICAGRKIKIGFNDLATTHPQLAVQAAGWKPTEYSAGASEKLLWKCGLGHEWRAAPANRTSKNATSCPFCANKKVLAGFNDLETTHPAIAKEAVGWNPQSFDAGSGAKVLWECKMNHQWIAAISSRTNLGTGCSICTGKKVLFGFNDIATKFPSIASQADGWDPKTVFAGSQKPLSWKCAYGHKWKASPGNRTGSQTGCPSCNTGGFDPNKDAWLYFLFHLDWEMLQIGITNFPDDRLGTHKSKGWELIEIRGPLDGHLTQQWETAILRMLKAKGADLSNENIAGKFDGYSEAWSKGTFQVESIKELMKLTDSWENGARK